MATPLTGLNGGGGGGVAVLTNPVNKVDSSANGGGGFGRSLSESPILIFSFFHKAIRNELDALHRLAMAFATGNCSDIQPLFQRYRFLRSMYSHHSNAEDEVQVSEPLLFLLNFIIILRFLFDCVIEFPSLRNEWCGKRWLMLDSFNLSFSALF